LLFDRLLDLLFDRLLDLLFDRLERFLLFTNVDKTDKIIPILLVQGVGIFLDLLFDRLERFRDLLVELF
jgi:hypothetical protein